MVVALVASAGLFVARYLYRHLAEHGWVLRVLGGCPYCGPVSPGVHVVCNCGLESPHFAGMDFAGRRQWRRSHRRTGEEGR